MHETPLFAKRGQVRQARLKDRCEGVKIKRVAIPQDVLTTWSSTFTSVKRLVYLKPAITLDEMLEPNISPLMGDLE